MRGKNSRLKFKVMDEVRINSGIAQSATGKVVEIVRRKPWSYGVNCDLEMVWYQVRISEKDRPFVGSFIEKRGLHLDCNPQEGEDDE